VALSDLAKAYRVNFPHLSKLNVEMSTRVYADEIKFQLPGYAFLAEGLEMTVEQGDCRCPFRKFKTGGNSEDFDRNPETGNSIDGFDYGSETYFWDSDPSDYGPMYYDVDDFGSDNSY
jgi:hypothetical protein